MALSGARRILDRGLRRRPRPVGERCAPVVYPLYAQEWQLAAVDDDR